MNKISPRFKTTLTAMASAFATCICVIIFFTGIGDFATFFMAAALHITAITIIAGAIAAIIPYSSTHAMKNALWILGTLLTLDVLFMSYFHVFRASYYFPGRYEDAFLADFWAIVFGIPVLCAFITLLIKHHRSRPHAGKNPDRDA